MQSQSQTQRTGRPWLVGLGLGVLFASLFTVGIVPRLHREAELAAAAGAVTSEVPVVTVAKVVQAPTKTSLDLPGEIKPFQEAAVFARSNGYLKRRLADIGDRVKAGQLLAEVESPELDRELDQARASLAQTEANLAKSQTDLALAKITASRWVALRKDGSVAQQDADEKQAAYKAQSATVASMAAGVDAARKNVQRLETLTRYERVEAPFAGTITARGVDPGALIGTAGGSSNGSLFKLVQLDRLRIDVSVPEPYAPAIQRGEDVTVTVRELGHSFPGKVVRTAGALDPATRTLLTEVELKNDGKLMPGMYARVGIEAERPTAGLQVPGNTIVTNAKGSQVVVVGPDDVAHFQSVQTGVDDGALVEVQGGLKNGDQVVVGPSDEISDGVKVKTVAAK